MKKTVTKADSCTTNEYRGVFFDMKTITKFVKAG
jgi:hypothetical protein